MPIRRAVALEQNNNNNRASITRSHLCRGGFYVPEILLSGQEMQVQENREFAPGRGRAAASKCPGNHLVKARAEPECGQAQTCRTLFNTVWLPSTLHGRSFTRSREVAESSELWSVPGEPTVQWQKHKPDRGVDARPAVTRAAMANMCQAV